MFSANASSQAQMFAANAPDQALMEQGTFQWSLPRFIMPNPHHAINKLTNTKKVHTRFTYISGSLINVKNPFFQN